MNRINTDNYWLTFISAAACEIGSFEHIKPLTRKLTIALITRIFIWNKAVGKHTFEYNYFSNVYETLALVHSFPGFQLPSKLFTPQWGTRLVSQLAQCHQNRFNVSVWELQPFLLFSYHWDSPNRPKTCLKESIFQTPKWRCMLQDNQLAVYHTNYCPAPATCMLAFVTNTH